MWSSDEDKLTAKFKIHLPIIYWPYWVFVAAQRLPLVVVSRGYSLTVVASLVAERGL